MFIKDLYINPKNVCTIDFRITDNDYGLVINGYYFKIGNRDYYSFKDKARFEIIEELRKYQQMIINNEGKL